MVPRVKSVESVKIEIDYTVASEQTDLIIVIKELGGFLVEAQTVTNIVRVAFSCPLSQMPSVS